jgi:glycosyltransferase involved in cell wall biosynthesis
MSWPSTVPRSDSQPFVSIVTPTYNRRPFLERLAGYILAQDYPLKRMEWVVYDDGTDPIEDLLAPLRSRLEIQYIRADTKQTIGAKRNALHRAARGDIIVVMDDDDIYPAERVSHAVRTLRSNRGAELAGSSVLYLYFLDDGSIWSVGPWFDRMGPNHGTFGTMAFTKKYGVAHTCDETVLHAEEMGFTNHYKNRMVQLDPAKTMLVCCHANNTFDKRGLREATDPIVKKTSMALKQFVPKAADRAFYAPNQTGDLNRGV